MLRRPRLHRSFSVASHCTSAFAGRRGETLVAERIVNHACLHVVPAGNCDGNREIRVSVNVIRRPIERVDDPGELIGAGSDRLGSLLFANEGMLRESARNNAADRILRCEIGIRDEIADAFLASLKSALPGK